MRPFRHAALALLLTICGAISCASSAPRVETVAAPPPPSGLDLDRFEAEIARFEASDRTAPPAPGGILFVGSSSIRLWRTLDADFPGLPVINRGFGGSTLYEVNHYAPRIVLPYRPRLIVLYAGDNEIATGRTAEQLAGDYRAFVSLVRAALPTTRIAFVSVKPSPSRWSFQQTVREANRLVRAITATDPLQTFVDVFTPMLGNEGRPRAELFVSDSLHMTPQGYAIWRRQLAPVVR
ncbi:MAG TPA: SGNH/GDSL hydrolase family protein [Gemmatimonadaceae bacterium]|nr:SGNH/GDSL hydrolase family protein [Gemmatimonadaceae bacterium]